MFFRSLFWGGKKTQDDDATDHIQTWRDSDHFDVPNNFLDEESGSSSFPRHDECRRNRLKADPTSQAWSWRWTHAAPKRALSHTSGKGRVPHST